MPRPGGAKPRHHTTALAPVESATPAGASVILYRPSMATSTRHTNGGAAPATIENYERERVFGLFRQFGYLEAELNPLGLLPPQPHPDLQLDNEWAREARRIRSEERRVGKEGRSR